MVRWQWDRYGAGMLRGLVHHLIARAAVRRAMCTWCAKVPRRDGDDYCSDACARADADMQAFGL